MGKQIRVLHRRLRISHFAVPRSLTHPTPRGRSAASHDHRAEERTLAGLSPPGGARTRLRLTRREGRQGTSTQRCPSSGLTRHPSGTPRASHGPRPFACGKDAPSLCTRFGCRLRRRPAPRRHPRSPRPRRPSPAPPSTCLAGTARGRARVRGRRGDGPRATARSRCAGRSFRIRQGVARSEGRERWLVGRPQDG